MSKEGTDDLVLLVKALSKSEKRYFKLFASRLQNSKGKKFITLFNWIDRHNTYNEEKLLKQERSVKPSQIPNLRSHLQKQILQSLKLYHSSGLTDIKIRNLIDYSQLLYNKGLYHQCLKTLDKAKKMAIANDRSILTLDILEQEKIAISHSVSKNNEEQVNKIISETQSVAASIQNINTFSNLAAKLNSFYVKIGFIRNEQDFKMVKDFFYSSLPLYEEKSLSFQEKLYLYHSFVSYYFFIQNFEKGYKYALKWTKLFEGQPEMIVHKLEMYLKGINSLLVAQNKLSRFSEFEETYKKLLKVHSLKGIQLTENIQMMLFKYKYMHKINHYFMMGDFTGGTKIISVVENELDRLATRMDRHYIILFYYKVACLYFGSGNFKKALLWLNKLINSKDIHLREDILSFARILNLICHYELENIDLIEHHLKSTYRFLLKKEEFYKYHTYILNFLKNLTKEIQGKKLIRRFSDLKGQLLPLEEHPYEKRPFLYFDIISWLESKIENKPIEEVVKKKLKALSDAS